MGCGSSKSSSSSGGGCSSSSSSNSSSATSASQTTAIINQAKADYAAAQNAYNNATNDVDRAKAAATMSTSHAIAESARAAAGWGSGGVDGSATDAFMTTPSSGGTTGYGGTSGYIQSTGAISSCVIQYLPTTTMSVTDGRGNVTTTNVIVYEGRAYDANTGEAVRSVYEDQGATVTWNETEANANGVYGTVSVVLPKEIRDTYSSSSSATIVPTLPEIPTPPSVLTQDTRVNVTKYEYVYGLKEIEVNRNNNYKNCVYVSTPINVDAPIAQVSLDASENHPLFTPPDAGNRVVAPRHTSIEYYISFVENPTNSDWLPILPTSQDSIMNELLFVKNNLATVRFPILTTYPVIVYKNGVSLDQNQDWSVSPTATGIIFSSNIDINADYTIDYTPDGSRVDPHIQNVFTSTARAKTFIGADNSVGEVFECANYNCSVTLSKTPYIDYNQVNGISNYNCNTSSYIPIKVYLENGAIAIPGNQTLSSISPYNADAPGAICTKNMTDYVNRTHKALSAYDITTDNSTGNPKHMVFEYYQDGNKLYFTETFQVSDDINNMDVSHGHANIRVCYDYLASSVRVKIIMRRTGITELVNLTPNVTKYTLSMTTL